jgi:hypothetical protein
MASRNPYDRVTIGGHTLDRLTYSALKAADRKFHKRTGKHMRIAQGSYNAGGVSASAGTHDGGGCVDLAGAHLTTAERGEQRWALRQVGFASWTRQPPTFPWHEHAVLIGNDRLSPQAAAQVRSYDQGRNGLANNAIDISRRPSKRRWSWRLRRPVKRG